MAISAHVMSSESFSPSRNPFLPPRQDSSSGPRVLARQLLGSAGERMASKIGRGGKGGRPISPSAAELSLSVEEAEAQQAATRAHAEGETLENYRILQEAREYLGPENVHGVADVEYALGFQIDRSKVPPIPYRKADFEISKKLRALEEDPIHEMLILCVAEDDQGRPMTGEVMNEIFTTRYREKDLGKFLANPEHIKEEVYFTDEPLKYEWRLVTKACVPHSLRKRVTFVDGYGYSRKDTQDFALQEFAEAEAMPVSAVGRPAPFEMLFIAAVHLLNTDLLKPKRGERLLSTDGHCAQSSVGDKPFIIVMDNSRHGLFVGRVDPFFMNHGVGTYMERDAI